MDKNSLVEAFKKELSLTEKGLAELTEKKKGLVIDVSTDDGFKLARKERTEQNKLLERIDRIGIDGKKAVDDARGALKESIIEIYSSTVTAFEAEDVRRKQEEKRKKEEEENRINGIREEINGIRLFSSNLHGKPSQELQEIIEAVDMIDVSESFAELTQEALTTKTETLSELNHALVTAIQNENLEAERETLRKERGDQEEKARIDAIKAKARERLNNLAMIPVEFLGKSSTEIDQKIKALTDYEVKEDEFGELFAPASETKGKAIAQLASMLEQAEIVEKVQADEEERQRLELEQAQEQQVEPEQASIPAKVEVEPETDTDGPLECELMQTHSPARGEAGYIDAIVEDLLEKMPVDIMREEVEAWADNHGLNWLSLDGLYPIIMKFKAAK